MITLLAMHISFLVDQKVTWLEATIAAPVFSGLVTYYIEGDKSDRCNLMDTALSQATRSWGVRGNIFSFLLPWETVLTQLFEKVEDGDLSQWPLAPDVVLKVVRVRFIRGPEDLLQKFRDLYVRSKVVKKLAEIYIDRKVQDLANRPGVLQIHTFQKCATVAESLKAHVAQRVDALYPPALHGSGQGALLPGLEEVVKQQRNADNPRTAETAFDDKQSTSHDASRTTKSLFENVRPSLVADEGDAQGTFAPEVVLEHAVDNVLDLTVRMSNTFEDQFLSKYLPRICPWAFYYDCGVG